MKQPVKSKRVSWASGDNLCQVALFRKEDTPSQIKPIHEHRRAKSLRISPANAMDTNDVPPGFGGSHLSKRRVPRTPSIKWKFPPRFAMNSNWFVVAGEESQEVITQRLRESRVREAIYPRDPIPSNPSVSLEVQNEHYDDSLTPIIPIIPIEEIEMTESQCDIKAPVSNTPVLDTTQPFPSAQFPVASETGGTPHTPPAETKTPLSNAASAAGDDAVNAAYAAALNPFRKSCELDSIIKILSDPKMIKSLVSSVGQHAGLGNSKPTMPMSNSSVPVSGLECPSVSSARNGYPAVKEPLQPFGWSNKPPPPSLHQNHVPVVGRPCSTRESSSISSTSSPALMPAGDTRQPPQMTKADYYKNLIRQHGEERRGNINQTTGKTCSTCPVNPNPIPIPMTVQKQRNIIKETKNIPKIKKRCMYFNTKKGCRNGPSCPFQHDDQLSRLRTSNFGEEQIAKRMRVSEEIMGR